MRTRLRCILVMGVAILAHQPATAQTSAVEAAKMMAGQWEISNADHDKSCMVELKADTAPSGFRIEFDRAACAADFPPLKDASAWNLVGDNILRIVDAKGRIAFEFTEVENGMYESLRPGQPLTFLQSAAVTASATHSVDQVAGDWNVVRGDGPPICTLTLSGNSNAADLPLRVKPGCDAAVTRFGPATWRIERGELIVKSARGQVWRFGDEDGNWRLVPQEPDPLMLTRR
jgi:hypothetical protein